VSTMRIFVSHSHEDDAFCRALVEGLRRAGADVWYDEHNLGSGQLMTVIQRELGSRPVFIVILTRATFASRWVRRETLWAYELGDRDPTRILLPVTAGPIERSDFSAENEWLFLHDFKRIEAPGYQPYPQAEAVTRTLHALQLTLPGEAPLSTGPLPADSVADLIGRGRALNAQGKYAQALPLFQRALERDPRAVDAWLTAGYTLGNLERYEEALVALDRALALNPNSPRAWSNKGAALNGLRSPWTHSMRGPGAIRAMRCSTSSAIRRRWWPMTGRSPWTRSMRRPGAIRAMRCSTSSAIRRRWWPMTGRWPSTRTR
jgi:TIR domain/Tetratricopeptide repeat